MKKVGDKINPRYKGIISGQLEVKAIAKLPEPKRYWFPDTGEIKFNPTIMLLETAKEKNKVIWFPYWIAYEASGGKERYGQFAPMLDEQTFLSLLKHAIRQDFFSKGFLNDFHTELELRLNK